MNQQRSEPQYSEWVLPNWTSFLPVLGIYPTMWLTFLPINLALGASLGIGLSAFVLVLMIAKSPRIKVTDRGLSVANASIDRKFIAGVTEITAEDGFAARGRELDPRAWIHFQGSVKTLVKVIIQDPEDPTPYWLFSTRKPGELKKALGY